VILTFQKIDANPFPVVRWVSVTERPEVSMVTLSGSPATVRPEALIVVLPLCEPVGPVDPPTVTAPDVQVHS